MTFDELLALPPYSLDAAAKEAALSEILTDLTAHHYAACPTYRAILDKAYPTLNLSTSTRLNSPDTQNPCNPCNLWLKPIPTRDIPFLPVPLFKSLELSSIAKEDLFKTMTSSGTTGQAVSKIFLDRETATRQQKVLVKIVSAFTGAARLPMLIIDSPSVIKNRLMFSARGAGILGFSIFGADRTYALDDDMRIDYDAIEAFLARHQGQRILLFGFTFMIWQYFYKELLKSERKLDLSKGVLIHGGGWKKLASEAVSPKEFRNRLDSVCGLNDIHDYYGMVEQTGCVYMQCEQGHLHASIFSDIIIRRGSDFSVADIGEKGIVQVLSTLPKSYPGHSLLTQDEGMILGEDDCPCGRKGKYFKIFGRLKNAEVRGCSDTFEKK